MSDKLQFVERCVDNKLKLVGLFGKVGRVKFVRLLIQVNDKWLMVNELS